MIRFAALAFALALLPVVPARAEESAAMHTYESFDGTPILLASATPQDQQFYAELSDRTRIIHITADESEFLQLPRKQFAAFFVPHILQAIEDKPLPLY